MDIQTIIDEIKYRIDIAIKSDDHTTQFALINLLDWIKENEKH